MSFVFAPPQQPVVPVQDEPYSYFPIRRVFGIAKNYAEPGAATKDTPFYFMKDCYTVVPVADGECAKIPMPPQTQALKHEIELVACLGKGGRNLTLEQAAQAVWGWCVGIDFTLGDQKLPSGANDITRAKSFERAAPVSYVRSGLPLPDACARRSLALRQQPQAPGRKHLQSDRPALGNDRPAVAILGAPARRHDLHGHLRRRGQGLSWRPS